MQIKSLEKMESIVAKNKALSWDGWTVISSYPSDKGRTSKFGAYVNGKWHIQTCFVPSNNGWDIPDKLIG
jgi:hypothetical protein